MLPLLLTVWVLGSVALVPQEQDTTASPPRPVLDFEAISQQVAASLQERDSLPQPPALTEGLTAVAAGDSVTRAKQQAALRAYFDYRIQGFDHRLRVFEWQLLSSRIIFVVVILLVLAGVYLSGVQFRRGLRERPPSDAPAESEAVTEIEASMGGIKVSSSTLGVIILVISLAFFYLYLVFVYPIEEIL